MGRILASKAEVDESESGDEKTDDITSSENTDGIDIHIDTGDKTFVECFADLGGAGTINVYGSKTKEDWRLVDTIVLTAADEWHKGYFNAYRYVKLEVPTTGIAVTLELTAK